MNGVGSRLKVISTGSSEIDKKLGGGIPAGSLTLLEGQSDSGKSVVAQQMIWGSLHDGASVVLYTTENTVKSFIRQMASLALDVLDFVLLGRLRIVEVSSGRSGLSAAEVLELLVISMRKDTGADMMVVDSLTTFVSHGVSDEAVAYFEDCREICSDYGKTIINISNSYAFDNSTLARLRSMCDAHLSLRVEEVGDKLVKILEVSKIRGASKTTGNIITFDVEPNLGMRIIPISKASA
ncbi:MAG: AAA family ATPase [Chloroflexi bacterium]|nr:AAA family ATPase [Chloroflexota bacterium]MCH8234862.1 AAA family ATPase [Chloroflexota bacterium]MCH8817268.1 AAA family ATPase [Chloroflexota bacterium]